MLPLMHKAKHIKVNMPLLAHVRERTQIVLYCKLQTEISSLKGAKHVCITECGKKSEANPKANRSR
jgi:hypothetical protein